MPQCGNQSFGMESWRTSRYAHLKAGCFIAGCWQWIVGSFNTAISPEEQSFSGIRSHHSAMRANAFDKQSANFHMTRILKYGTCSIIEFAHLAQGEKFNQSISVYTLNHMANQYLTP
jgi:hypothetical protein